MLQTIKRRSCASAASYVATFLAIMNAFACRDSPRIVLVEIIPDTVIQAPGETMHFTVSVLDGSVSVVTTEELTWESSDSSVVRVSRDGAAVSGSPGSATVQATVDGVVDSALVMIVQPDELMNLNRDVLGTIGDTCVSGGCHNGPTSTLNLTVNPLARLVDVRAVRNPAFDLIVPYEPDISWLLLEFTDGLSRAVNPAANHHQGVSRSALPLIRRWIQAGAREE